MSDVERVQSNSASLLEYFRQGPPAEHFQITPHSMFVPADGQVPDLSSGEVVYKPSSADGQLYVRMERSLADLLPGSVLLPVPFLDLLGYGEEKIAEYAARLLGTEKSMDGSPILSYDNYTIGNDEIEPLATPRFKLNVFNGSFNPNAIQKSKLAQEIFDLELENDVDAADSTSFLRAEYQGLVQDSIEQTYTHNFNPNIDSSQKPGGWDMRIVEDCLATADSIEGVLAAIHGTTLLSVSGESSKPKRPKVRIDVDTATTQGIMSLMHFGRVNQIDIELNVAQLAYGLSEGEETTVDHLGVGYQVKQHSNYLTYPFDELLASQFITDEVRYTLEDLRKQGIHYVVGDMGDNLKSIPNTFDVVYPWNSYRNDSHGIRSTKSIIDTSESILSGFDINRSNKELYFYNGGYALEAMVKHIYDKKGWGMPLLNMLGLQAKRIFVPNGDNTVDLAVLIYDLKERGILEEIYKKFSTN